MALVAAPALAQTPFPPPPPEVQEARDMYSEGRYRPAFDRAFPFAERGDPWAQNLVAQVYYYGLGVPQDCRLALRWHQRAADQSMPLAMGNLARHRDLGCRGTNTDIAEALRWYDAAAAAGATGYAADHARFLASGRTGLPDGARIRAVLAPALAEDLADAKLALAEWLIWHEPGAEALAAAQALTADAGEDPAARLLAARIRLEGKDGATADPAEALERLTGLTTAGYYPAAPLAAHLRLDPGAGTPDPVEAWALCVWALDQARPDELLQLQRPCLLLTEKVGWQDKTRGELRGRAKGTER